MKFDKQRLGLAGPTLDPCLEHRMLEPGQLVNIVHLNIADSIVWLMTSTWPYTLKQIVRFPTCSSLWLILEVKDDRLYVASPSGHVGWIWSSLYDIKQVI